MRHDPFLNKKSADPDAVVKSTPAPGVRKCGRCPYLTAAEKRVAKGSGDFTDCMDRIAPKVKPDDPEAFCAWYEHEQTGRWPGEKRKAFGGKKAPQFKPEGHPDQPAHQAPAFKKDRGAPATARPPGPRVIEVDGDQDSLARTMSSSDPTDSWRPGYVTDAAEEGGELYGARPEALRPRISDQVPPTGDLVGQDRAVGKTFRPVGKSDRSDQSDTLQAAAAKGWIADGGISAVRGGGVVLSHMDLPGHQVHVAEDGKWSHMGPSARGQKLHEAGADADDLKDHLRGLHTGFAKSGPRVA